MNRPALAIGLDVGSTNVKAVAVADDGSIVAHWQRTLVTDERPPICEQNPDEIWDAVLAGIAACLTASFGSDAISHSGSSDLPLVTIGVASQYSSTVPVRSDGTPAGPVLMWRDRRGTDACRDLLGTPGLFELWVERHGIPPIGGGLSLGHLLHLIAEDPDGDTRFVEVMDYVTARLTGLVTATRHTMLTSQLCDKRRPGAGTSAHGADREDGAALLADPVLRYDPELLAATGIGVERLPQLVVPHRPVGALTAGVAARFGVSPNSMVATGINDTAAAAIATGADAQRDDMTIAGVAIGTTSVVVTGMGHKTEDLDHEMLTMPAPDGGYLLMAENGLGGRVPEALLALLDGAGPTLSNPVDKPAEGNHDDAAEPLEVAAARASARFAEAEEALAITEPGAGGVLCLPWLAGSMAPSGSSTASGGFIGVTLATTRDQLIRATFEGVAHNLAWLLRHVEAFIDQTVTELRLTGGGATVEGWPQVIADVVNRPVRVVPEPSLAVARAAALRALTQVSDRSAAPASSASTQPALRPDPQTRELYDRHQQAFEATFEALRPVWNLLSS